MASERPRVFRFCSLSLWERAGVRAAGRPSCTPTLTPTLSRKREREKKFSFADRMS
jgi:hypothetical protein